MVRTRPATFHSDLHRTSLDVRTACARTAALDERGTAFAEFLVTFPFLVIMLMGITDLGMALNTHLTLGRIAYEGSRFAATVALLEKPAAAGDSVDTDSEAVGKPGHQSIRQRVNDLLDRNEIDRAQLPADYLSTARIPKEDIGATADQVRVTIRVPFQTMFPLLRGLLPSLSSEVTGPYLYVE